MSIKNWNEIFNVLHINSNRTNLCTDSITKAKKYEVAIMYKYLYIREIYTITSMNHSSPRYAEVFSQNFNLKIHKQLQKISLTSKDIRSTLKDERSDVKSKSDTYFISLQVGNS